MGKRVTRLNKWARLVEELEAMSDDDFQIELEDRAECAYSDPRANECVFEAAATRIYKLRKELGRWAEQETS